MQAPQDIDARQLPVFPELEPAAQRRYRLRSFADDAVLRGQLLSCTDPKGERLVGYIKTLLSKLRLLCAQYSGTTNDAGSVLAGVNELQQRTGFIPEHCPKLGDFYTAPLNASLVGIERELKAATTDAKSKKESA